MLAPSGEPHRAVATRLGSAIQAWQHMNEAPLASPASARVASCSAAATDLCQGCPAVHGPAHPPTHPQISPTRGRPIGLPSRHII
eukprot:354010-Chlamydomonas_euryale.AAC.10